jgi:hypothetical protein
VIIINQVNLSIHIINPRPAKGDHASKTTSFGNSNPAHSLQFSNDISIPVGTPGSFCAGIQPGNRRCKDGARSQSGSGKYKLSGPGAQADQSIFGIRV